MASAAESLLLRHGDVEFSVLISGFFFVNTTEDFVTNYFHKELFVDVLRERKRIIIAAGSTILLYYYYYYTLLTASL